MTRRWMGVVLLLAAATWPVAAQDAKNVIANASKAMGSDSLKSVEFSGSGFDFTLGQAPNPSSPWPKFNDKTYTRSISFDPLGSRMQRIRRLAGQGGSL